jgi:aminobenzoyl-glutamate transport protein
MDTGHAATPAGTPATLAQRLLNAVERVGNRVPHPVMIFVYLILGVVLLRMRS